MDDVNDSLTALIPLQSEPSTFELLITCNPPILESLIAQIPTESIFNLYHSSPFLRRFLQSSPTSWRYISWRLQQPTGSSTAVANNQPSRQSSNYALDQLLIYVINPFSTRLVSLELDNTAVSGGTLTQTVLVLRRDTLQHVSVRGCKNVSLKYHINPWLQIHALARERSEGSGPPGFDNLALKSLYTYRCRHHRRRPYLPSSLTRKESDSEPTHELVLTCHKLGIWTDTAWCTTPGARCFRRRGYVTMRVPQEPREVWVVYDRLWRSRNWLGSADQPSENTTTALTKKRKRDARAWEFDEEAVNGEALGTKYEGKAIPAHLRSSHTRFVENIKCQNCLDPILERCEQCSILMHCSGCRKTLCSSCAFDRPYLRNKNAPEEEREKFWWAPGCAISPCSMQDSDAPPPANNMNAPQNGNVPPNIRFKWCCTEPVFSGGGGITFGHGMSRDADRIRAAPLQPGEGWEDKEFDVERLNRGEIGEDISNEESNTKDLTHGPAGRWSSIDNLFNTATYPENNDIPPLVPRILCDECFGSEKWKVHCKACALPLCVKHDVRDRLKVRICGYKDLPQEKQEYKSRQRAFKLISSLVQQRKEKLLAHKAEKKDDLVAEESNEIPTVTTPSRLATALTSFNSTSQQIDFEGLAQPSARLSILRTSTPDTDIPIRPLSRGSTSTDPPSRSSSPTPSAQSVPATPEPSNPRKPSRSTVSFPRWRGCQGFFCPAVRSPGDHRRRCVATMQQCTECKIHVCGDCVSSLEPPCPCKGCRSPPNEEEVAAQLGTENLRFFCPNCRWDRMQTGKCKRRSEAFLSIQAASKKSKRKEKLKKPIGERRTSVDHTDLTWTGDEAIDGLVDFFTNLNAQLLPDDLTEVDDQADIQELEDMGTLARDLIRRIQRLREQFRPGSSAAMALPDVRLEEDDDDHHSAEEGQVENEAFAHDVEASTTTEGDTG